MNRFLHFGKNVQDLVGRQERHARYRGTARVDISRLKLEGDQQILSFEQVDRLQSIFANEGYNRLEPANRIAALVSQQELATLLSRSKFSYMTLLRGAEIEDEPPKLVIPVYENLRVLHGQHRLEAAKSHFPSNDAWWTVDLFLDGKILSRYICLITLIIH